MKNIYLFLIAVLFLTASSFSQEIKTLRVMTYNIHHGQGIDKKLDIDRIGLIIKESKTDLAALQEVDRGVERTGRIDIMQMLYKNTEMDTAFGKNIAFQGGSYGNGIVSVFKIDSVKNLHYRMLRDGEQRGLLQTFIKVNKETFIFMNTHTGDKNTEDEKVMNADEILSILKTCSRMPVILCGDFNDQPGSSMHQTIKKYFVDIWEYLSNESGYTFPASRPDRRIDYIYISKESLNKLRPVNIRVLQSEASDHLPIIAEFQILE